MIDLQKLQNSDPIKRIVEKQTEQEEFSPMDPPAALNPPNLERVPYKKLPVFLQKLMDEHKVLTKEIKKFEKVLSTIEAEGVTQKSNEKLGKFFELLDKKQMHHNTKEEKILFPLLQEKLLEVGEHSKGEYPKTALDIMEEDHSNMVQVMAVAFNLLQLAPRLPDKDSQLIVLDAALNQCKELIESLRIHLFREDNVVFALAYKYISKKEFKKMEQKLSMFDYYGLENE